MSSGRTSPIRTVLRRCPIFRLTIFAAIVAASTLVPADVFAIDRNEIRFRKLLLGRHDGARVAALRSIPLDFQSRSTALPIIVESLAELREDPRFDRAEQQGLPDLPDGVRMMIDFVGTIDRPDATETLVELLDCDHLSWVMATIQTLCKNQHHDAIDELIALMDSEHFDASYGFRFTLARGLKDMKHPDAWEGLAKLFDRVDGQLAHRLDQEFQIVTAEDFGGDVERFQTWRSLIGLSLPKDAQIADGLQETEKVLGQDAKTDMPLPKKMGLQPSQTAAAYTRAKRLKPSHYYGIDIHAKRLLFVIDRSGSMRTIVNGQARIQSAKRELITVINALDEQCEFGILVFDSDVRAWREELVQATDKNKLGAIRFVEYLSAGSSTNTYEALRRSLSFDPQLEAVFLLTDGEPTTGRIVNPSAIMIDILRRNEVNNITINTIAVAVEPLMATFLRNLTLPSNGEFRVVR